MRRRLGLLVLASCVAAACGSSTNVDAERQALLALDREWSQQNREMDRFLLKFAPEGSLHLPGLPVATGQTAIRNATNQFAESPGFSMRWSPSKADASGDLGYTVGTYQISRNNPTGQAVKENGKYVTAWKKDSGGTWKVAEFIFNADAAPPAPAAVPPSPKK